MKNERTPRQAALPTAPDNWDMEVLKVLRTRPDDDSHRKAAEKMLQHRETETALRFLLRDAARNSRNFGPGQFAWALHACASEAALPPNYSFSDWRKARKLLAALDVLAAHPDIHFILDPRKEGFFPLGEDALLPGIEDARRFLSKFAYRPAHRPPDHPQILLAMRLGKLFNVIVGCECRPAIDALLTATFGPHREVSKLLQHARQHF